jgi:3-hydroxyacyl-[acyl-carrier-protein] dehydratase
MFEGSLYTITHFNCQENKVLAKIVLNPEHEIFKGHFPDMPILPGVCTIQIIKELLSKKINQNLILLQGDNIKFISLVNPNETLNLDIDITILSITDGQVQINCVVTDKETAVFKMKGVYKCL